MPIGHHRGDLLTFLRRRRFGTKNRRCIPTSTKVVYRRKSMPSVALDLINCHGSVRKYKPDPIPAETLKPSS